ncbi:MAG TPA: metallophosphoesterase [Ktedonosporobacter sp.]|nr:metallophosphoesterase [Ktedonosporobacter sp.]
MTENTVENELEQESPVQKKHSDGVITVVLTADNHLGYTAFGQHPRKREERQQRLRHAFQQATDFAIMQGVDLFIQAGDLFDTTTPDERDRSFVAARLAQLKQAGVRAFALGGVHDTATDAQSLLGEALPSPQSSYERLGALQYFPPLQKHETQALEPVILDIDDIVVGICGLGVLAGQEGDPLANLRVQSDIERAAITILLLHAPIEGLAVGSSLLDTQALISQSSIEKQSAFHYILAGYHHSYRHLHIGQTEVIVAGATQHVDFSVPDHAPGFVFLGLAADGVRWCNHISVDTLMLQRLTIQTEELWRSAETADTPTEIILARLRPLCDTDAMIQLRLEGELTRRQYHQLDLNQIRRYGEEHCFALAIDDSALVLLAEQDVISAETGERFSPREELIALIDEKIAATSHEREKRTLQFTKEELLLAMDEIKGR